MLEKKQLSYMKNFFKKLFCLHTKTKYLGPTVVLYLPSEGIKFEDLYECVACGHQYRMPEGWESDRAFDNLKLELAQKLKKEGQIDLAIQMLKV